MIEFVGKNSISNLKKIIEYERMKKILIFTGHKSFENIKDILFKNIEIISHKSMSFYSDFSTNPKEDDVEKAVLKLKDKFDFDLIIAIGGGSVIDFAKLFRLRIDNDILLKKYVKKIKDVKKIKKETKLIAIPTTAGTGSQATQFAVVYIDGKKYSIDGSFVLPDYSIVDSQFLKFNSRYLKACTAMDAYCQAIESFWAKRATEESLNFAKNAIKLCKDNIVEYVNTKNEKCAENMSIAAHLAGKAINISRTTAAHALSYKITSEYNIPHGHAVSLTIANLIKKNSEIEDINTKTKMKALYELIGFSDPKIYFNKIFKEINLEQNFQELGINDFKLIVNSVNLDRLKNNPKPLTQKDLIEILTGENL